MNTIKRYGFAVTAVLVILAVFLAIIFTVAPKAQATAGVSQVYVLPSSDTVTHAATTYIILWDIRTGDLVNAATGATSASTTWADAAIDENHGMAVHAQNGLVWTSTFPALSGSVEYGMAIFNNATPTKTDVPTMGPFLYNASINKAYSDTNPVSDAIVRMKQTSTGQ